MDTSRATRACAVCIVTAALSACSFVQLTPAGEDVLIRSTADIAQCESLGVVSAQTKSRVIIERSTASVQNELYVLARNEAAMLDSNAIVPIGEPSEGRQSFRAYACGDI